MTDAPPTSSNTPDPPQRKSIVQGIVEMFLGGNLSIMLCVATLIVGLAALLITPREEEPQITVPMADVIVDVPGASAHEVERQVSTRLERLLYQIDGVEYVYSISRTNQAVITARFYVGEDRVDSLVKLHNKLTTSSDLVPASVAGWVIKPVEVDDVPIVSVTLYSDDSRYDDADLRRFAEELETTLQAVPNTGRTYLIGGRPRTIKVRINAELLSGRGLTWSTIANSLRAANVTLPAGSSPDFNEQLVFEAGTTLTSAQDVAGLIVGVSDGRPIYLRDVATITDGPAEPTTYTTIGLPPKHGQPAQLYPAVTLGVAKKTGTNAVWVAQDVHKAVEEYTERVLPAGIHARITRDNGHTANEKVNELVEALIVAVIIVIGLLTIVMGWRAALVVALAVPLTFSLTLLVDYLTGYTINRVTLFALILALGLVVDDPIVDVENIHRHLSTGKEKARDAVLRAVNEVRPPIILATLAVIASFVPVAFVTGMMGAYMGPMALNVPVAMLMSLVVAFTVTPWLAYHALKNQKHDKKEQENANDLHRSLLYKAYSRTMQPMLDSRGKGILMLLGVIVLFILSLLPPALGGVPLKMLPYNNRDEFQVVVDMPEGATLENTAACTQDLATYFLGLAETVDVTSYVGTASPMDFNGLVRHYFLRQGSNVADLRINILPRRERSMQSHAIALRVRADVDAIGNKYGANLKIVETPPGPPVISTLTAEVYGPIDADHDQLLNIARNVEQRFVDSYGVVDVDSSIEAEQTRWTFVTDKDKAALAGLTTQQIASELASAIGGDIPTYLHVPDEANPLPVELRLNLSDRHQPELLKAMHISTPSGATIPIGELGSFEKSTIDQPIYRKNLQRVSYVFGETAGVTPGEAILGMFFDLRPSTDGLVPPGYQVVWTGEGEWKITVDAFRDLGLAFGVACLAIYVLLVYETASFVMPLILMISIPLTIIGVMPGFWILNLLTSSTVGGYEDPVYFTATAMIGMIALAGITVRNAILLIDFIHAAVRKGATLQQAILDSGAVRIRPIFLTAATAMLAAMPITLDPVFSGLAWALIFGLAVSTAFTLVVIPVTYWLIYGRKNVAP